MAVENLFTEILFFLGWDRITSTVILLVNVNVELKNTNPEQCKLSVNVHYLQHR